VATAAWSQGGGGPANPQDLNRYAYVLNNPVRNTDPTGHCTGSVSATPTPGSTSNACSSSNRGSSTGSQGGRGNTTSTGSQTVANPNPSAAASQANATRTISGRPIGRTGKNYDSENGQGVYVLKDPSTGQVKYVGRGDANSRVVDHKLDPFKKDLEAQIVAPNNLTRAEARGLEQALIDRYGGPLDKLFNKINGINPLRTDSRAQSYREAGGKLIDEAVQIIGQ
jgi:hypothetical protein